MIEKLWQIPTIPPVTGRAKPHFVRSGGVDGESSPLSRTDAIRYLTASSKLPTGARIHYTHFVVDRVDPYRELLTPFVLDQMVTGLETALGHFAGKYSDPNFMASLFTASGFQPEGSEPGYPIPRDLFALMAATPHDAAQFLFRLGPFDRTTATQAGLPVDRIDPDTLPPRLEYPLELKSACVSFPELTNERMVKVYELAVRDRIRTQKIIMGLGAGDVHFAAAGAGHEVCQIAAAIALADEVGIGNVAISPYYRQGALIGTWLHLNGCSHDDYVADSFRQMMSRATDPSSGGRNMGSHDSYPQFHVLPVKSALGMNLGQLVGYLKGWKMAGRNDVVGYAEIGDGTVACSDFHEGLLGATHLELPMIINIADNGVAISVENQGRIFTSLRKEAEARGAGFFTCDGNDFLGVYETTRRAAGWAREHRRPVIMWTQNIPRLNSHSSSSGTPTAGGRDFDFNQPDPLVELGRALVDAGVLQTKDIVRLKPAVRDRIFFGNIEYGDVGSAAKDSIDDIWKQVRAEPEPTYDEIRDHAMPPLPVIVEPRPSELTTILPMSAAIRGALAVIMEQHPLAWIYGQDVGAKGGVFQCTNRLQTRFPRRVEDSPINEPMIMGAAMGFALHKGAIALHEIQFADYIVNTIHWLVHMAHLHWATNGRLSPNVVIRTPAEPFGGGAIYHSYSFHNLLSAIAGLVVYAPSNSFDAAGMLLTAAEHDGPVLALEPKGLYRLSLGSVLPGEPTDETGRSALKKAVGGLDGAVPVIDQNFRVPLGQAIVRKPGSDITILTWGISTLAVGEAVAKLSGRCDCEVIDARTIAPLDLKTILTSVGKTRRLLVVHSDRAVMGPGRYVQGVVHEALAREGLAVASNVLGMDDVPAISQNVPREKDLVANATKVAAAVIALMEEQLVLRGTSLSQEGLPPWSF